ncbi:MAG: lipopolysaccharide kinase InaA family protein [Longimicrobiales bacterium]
MKRQVTPALSGFQIVDHPGVRALARIEVTPWVRYVLEGGSTLHAAAGSERDAEAMGGREPVFVIPAKLPRDRRSGAEERWVVRKFARGGRILPKLLGDRYLGIGSPRPFYEARVSEEIRERGVPTPRVLAAAVYSAGVFYRGDLVTEFVPAASDLVEILFDNRRKGAGGAGERLDALSAAGSLVRVLAGAGLRHRDLHAGNILLQWEGAAPRAFILDLDLSRLLPRGARASAPAMLRRLTRSLRKWEGGTGLRLSEREWATLEKAALG